MKMKRKFRKYFVLAGALILVLIGAVLFFSLDNQEPKCNFFSNVDLCNISCTYSTQCMYIGNEKCINKFQEVDGSKVESEPLEYRACTCNDNQCEVENE